MTVDTQTTRAITARAGTRSPATLIARITGATDAQTRRCLTGQRRWSRQELELLEAAWALPEGSLTATDDGGGPGRHPSVPREWRCRSCRRPLNGRGVAAHRAAHQRRGQSCIIKDPDGEASTFTPRRGQP